jgi:predicted DNA-binding transcriptional regulator AlpA
MTLSAQKQIEPLDRFITDKEVAAMFSVTDRTIWNWSKAGLIPGPVVQRGPRFTRWSLNEIREAMEKMRNAERRKMAS